jgi:hypothetical protein
MSDSKKNVTGEECKIYDIVNVYRYYRKPLRKRDNFGDI